MIVTRRVNDSPKISTDQLLKEIKDGIHEQFVLNHEKERVECRCGHVAIWWKTGYICGTITAYPCRFT